MAHSYLKFHGQPLLLDDLDIRSIAHCILKEGQDVQAGGALPTAIKKMLREWLEHLETAAPGCLDLKLDTFLSTQDDVRAFLTLLDRIEQRFKRFGAVVPGAYLNGLMESEVSSLVTGPLKIGWG
jgi:hypothetical protein